MRVRGRLAAGLLLAAGAVCVGVAVDAQSGYAAGNSSLAVSPGQGPPGAQFTATYRWLPARGRGHRQRCGSGQVTFEWDGSTLGRATPARTGTGCVAVLRTVPPPRAYHGTTTHTVSVTNDASARAGYTVIAPPPSQPSSAPAALPSAPEVAGPQATDVPVTVSDPATSPALASESHGGTTGTTVVLIGSGTVLFLAGAGMLGVIAWRRRGPERDASVPAPRVDMDTQPLPLRHRGTHRRSSRV